MNYQQTITRGMQSAAWCVPQTVSETVKANNIPVFWQGSKIRCNTCRDLQSRRSSSCRETDRAISTMCGEKKSILKNARMQQLPTTIHPERESSSLWQPSGISLLSITGKILAKVLLNRLNEHLEQSDVLPESQCGFRKDRGIIDKLHRQTASREMPGTERGPLHDLTKAFDSQSWGTLENHGKVRLSCQNS